MALPRVFNQRQEDLPLFSFKAGRSSYRKSSWAAFTQALKPYRSLVSMCGNLKVLPMLRIFGAGSIESNAVVH